MSGLHAERLDPIRWLGWPTLACVLATLVFAAPIRIAGFQLPEPVFPVAAAFAWAVIRPSILAPFVLLLLGVFLDHLWGGPNGLWGVSLIVAYATVLLTRNMMIGQSRAMMWAWFAFATLVAMTTAYLVTVLDTQTAPSLLSAFWQFLPTSLLFPFAHRLIERFEDADVGFR